MIRSSAISTAIIAGRVHGLRGVVSVWLLGEQVVVTVGPDAPELGAERIGQYDPHARCCPARQYRQLADKAQALVAARAQA